MAWRRLRGSVIVVAAGLCLGVGPVGADWLVLRDGTRVETQGPWHLDGRLVVFTGSDGKLSSLRESDLDLAASRRATEEAKAPKPSKPSPPPTERKAARRFTNADIPPGRPEPPAAEDPPAAEALEEGAAARSSAAELIVVASEQGADSVDGHVVVTGTLANASRDTATAVRLTVRVFGPDGGLLAEREATVERSALPPGEETDFRAEFPAVFAAFAVTFQPAARMLLSGEGRAEAAEEPETPEAPPVP